MVPVDRFFQSCYRPGLLKAILDGERPQPRADFFAAQPPVVTIVSHEGDFETETPQVTLRVELTDQGGGMETPTLKQNGAGISVDSLPERRGEKLRREFPVALVSGRNEFEVTSATAGGAWESEPARIVITYTRPQQQPAIFVVAIGVSDYQEPDLRLKYSARDAKAFAELFTRRGRGLYREVNIKTLLDRQATKAAIRQAFEEVLLQAQPYDVLVVFFAGHGAMSGQRYRFLPANLTWNKDRTTADDVRSQGIADDEIAELIQSVPTLKRVLILDTCNAGGAAGLLELAGRNPAQLRGTVARMNRAQGIFVIAAAAKGEEAKERKELEHGILTYALLAGLRSVEKGPLVERGVTPIGADRLADVITWFTFAHGEVPQLMKQFYGYEQDVQMSIHGTSFPILPVRD